jgi:hypothetical protein
MIRTKIALKVIPTLRIRCLQRSDFNRQANTKVLCGQIGALQRTLGPVVGLRFTPLNNRSKRKGNNILKRGIRAVTVKSLAFIKEIKATIMTATLNNSLHRNLP